MLEKESWFITAMDAVSQFRATKEPLKNIVKRLNKQRRLGSKERSKMSEAVFSWSRYEASLEEITELRQQILDGADFGELAREFSEDYGSARLGGSLGWSNPGSFVPQFEAAMGTLEIDEISEPIQTQFGWHILQVTGRRDQNMSERFLEMQAENFLRSRKFYDELPRWRQELRDDAFIVYKEPYDERM